MNGMWLKFLVQSHLLLTISSFIFSIAFHRQNGLLIDFSFPLALAVFGVYNLNRINKLKKNQLLVEMRFWYEQNSVFLQFSASSCLFISTLLYLFLLAGEPLSLILFGIIGIITMLYIFTIKRFNLRQIPWTKALWISVVWTCISVVIPKITSESFSWFDLHYFILFFALTIPGDMRDLVGDKPQMKTIPQLIGNQMSAFLFYSLIALFLVLNCFIENLNLIGIISVFLYSLILMQNSLVFRHELMDGLLLIFGICYFITG